MAKKEKSKKSASSKKSQKYVYIFADGKADGDAKQKPLLGGKGANLAEMTRIGLPVPPGFTISTEVCTYYYDNGKKYPTELTKQVEAGLAVLEKSLGKKFGDTKNPLLLSIRSGARDSMPGMMDTILNLGLNDATVDGLAKLSNNEWFAWDCYRRFVHMYGDVVMGVQPKGKDAHEPFDEVMSQLKKERHIERDSDLTVSDLKDLVRRYKSLIKKWTGKDFPQAPVEQLWGAIGAVFGSWQNERAIIYRRKYKIPHEWGTAVNVQAMVFGNMGDDSATGVAFTRDPATGENVFYGEYLINAQGEDVVAGVRTPKPMNELKKDAPKAYTELDKIRKRLEKHYHDMQDFEFTVERNKLFMLQTRNGKRTGLAAMRIASEMVDEGLITWKDALKRVAADSLSQVLAPVFDRKDRDQAVKAGRQMAKGLPAGPGAACGKIYFNALDAEHHAAKGEKVILVRVETSPEDIRGMLAAEGILTSRGGVSSHAALVARQMGKVCVCGCSELKIDYIARQLSTKDEVLKEGDYVSIDGTVGEVFSGQIKTAPSEVVQVLVDKSLKPQESKVYKIFERFMNWSDKVRRLSIRTNADQPDQALNAIAFGAEGIGLCRTEHMFFEGDRIDAVREMILAETVAARQKAVAKLLPYQREDFKGIFKAMKGFPVTIRTLDPPLHEFLPHEGSLIRELAEKMGVAIDKVQARINALHEANPMLGHRGCRLGVVYPEITEMQARAIFEAAAEVQKSGIKVNPEIMIPLVGFPKELENQLDVVNRVAEEVQAKQKVKLTYKVGTMIEIPRAALVADKIAERAEFFSFGTNDLTQTTLGMSRDDAGSFLPSYQEAEIVKANPFASVDQDGVGRLMEIAIQGGRATRKDIKLGICGEHGGDPDSIEFCHRAGLNYVSCSPFRVPIAKLAAAQAALR